MKNYCVYILWSPETYRTIKSRNGLTSINGHLEFYVGYGSVTRPLEHLQLKEKDRQKNPHKTRIIERLLKDEVPVRISFPLITPDQQLAKRMERFLISLIGRVDLGTGPLTNKKAGGDGGDLGPKTRKFLSVHRKAELLTEKGKINLQKLVEAGHTPVANEKRREALLKYQKTEKGKAHHKRAIIAAHSPEAQIKNKISHQIFAKTDLGSAHITRMVSAAHTHEALAKLSLSKRKFTKDQIKEIRNLIENGFSFVQIAHQYHSSEGTISKVSRHLGVYK